MSEENKQSLMCTAHNCQHNTGIQCELKHCAWGLDKFFAEYFSKDYVEDDLDE